MKTIFGFICNLAITLTVCIPCFVLFKWVGQKGVFDWLDILLIMVSLSAALLIAGMIATSKREGLKFKKFIDAVTVFTATTTVLYCGFTFLEWIFAKATDGTFIQNWEERLSLGLSLTLYYKIDEWRKHNDKKKNNALVVAAACATQAETEEAVKRLKNCGIEALVVERDSPMYIKGETDGLVQLQVPEKELEKAKELLK